MLGGMSDVTSILSAIEGGDPTAAAELLPLVYGELRKLAAARLAAEPAGHTLQPTALVHEAYLRLVGGGRPQDWAGRGHFFAAAAEAMRRVLVDAARRKRSARRGGPRRRLDLLEGDLASAPVSDELLDLDAALTEFAGFDPQAAEIVKLRVFAGTTVEEAAQFLGVSPRTAKRSWAYARAWLGRRLGGSEGHKS
jgi:RNA polymerase sigma factor (TIGR02999 family)